MSSTQPVLVKVTLLEKNYSNWKPLGSSRVLSASWDPENHTLQFEHKTQKIYNQMFNDEQADLFFKGASFSIPWLGNALYVSYQMQPQESQTLTLAAS